MQLSLNDNWELTYRDLSVAGESVTEITAAEDFINAGSLPCDVHMPLIRKGIIKDPVVADYCYDSEWIEEKSWWFKKQFTLTQKDLNARGVLLVLESLDLVANIYVNSQYVGFNQSCHYPFEEEIGAFLQVGENTLLVRLTDGHECVTKEQIRPIEDYVCTEADAGRGEKARAFLRKPQYVYGWDWAPRIATIGIMKNAYLLIHGDFMITWVHPVALETNLASQSARMRFSIQFESFLPITTAEIRLSLDMYLEEGKVLSLQKDVLAVSGVNFVDVEAVVENVRFWWPNGAGEQPLYTVCAKLESAEAEYISEPVLTGIRSISLNIDRLESGERRFAIEVNGVDIYCKGGNWIPADSVYARVTPEKYETLIRDARDCNFNMLRVWGGGLYERDEFYKYCDRYGILLWHDFMFACSLYPDEGESFRMECAKEIDYQTKRLRAHPCMALWCGNNENQWLYEDYFSSAKSRASIGGLVIYNEIAPRLIRANCSEIPYWRSSPYGGSEPNCNEAGDRHHWHDCTMNADMEKRITPEEYDKVAAKFVTEYGYIGPCSDKSIQKYFSNHPVDRGDRIWNLHNNTYEKETVPAGIRKHYIEPDKLDLVDYLRYGRLVQGLMYGYSLESVRFYKQSGGSLFWMYNDTWGEVGWTIIDYYLDRKPSYYYVKRAFAPLKLILRKSADGKRVCVMGVNDTPETVMLDVEYGYVGFGGVYDSANRTINIEPFSKGIAFEFTMPVHDLRRGVVFARAESVPLALLRIGDFRDYQLEKSTLTIEKVEAKGGDYEVTIKSSGYSHAVSFGLDPSIQLSDAYFDMLPGEVRTVTLYGAVTKVRVDEIKGLAEVSSPDIRCEDSIILTDNFDNIL